MLVSKSFFSNSYSSQSGGSIYVIYGSCIQYQVCSINSTITKYHGCHSYVYATKESYIIESSLSKSKGNYNCICLYGGSQLIDSTNISHAKCASNTAYACSNNPSSHLINFTSIFNNTADKEGVMYHNTNNKYVYRCNVIENTLNENYFSRGIVFNNGCDLLKISFCVFSSNSGKYLFFNQYGKSVVDQCFLDNKDVNETTYKEVSLTTTDHLVLNLSHLSTQECETNLPQVLRFNMQNQPKSSHKSKLMKILFSLFPCYHSK